MRAARVSLMLPESGVLRIKAAKGIDKGVAKRIRVGEGTGVSGAVYKAGKPFVATGIEKNHPLLKKKRYKTGSFVSMPLQIGDETIGVLNLTERQDGLTFSDDDMKFLGELAGLVSLVIKGADCCNRLVGLETLSVIDGLTGLFNRRYFDERLCQELHRAARHNSFFSLAILDIDDFKLFNDTEGYQAGNDVLRAISHIARESLRSFDIIARYGGEELAIIMPGTGKEDALLAARRAGRNFEEFMSGRWENFPRRDITVSIGIASFPWDGKDAAALLRYADNALYKAQVGGKNRKSCSMEKGPADVVQSSP